MKAPQNFSVSATSVATLAALSAVPVACIAFALTLGQPLLSQAAPSPAPAPQSVLTLDVQTRLVVEDVLVTDAHGQPIHGLPQSAFHVFDQGKPQTIRSFEEGSAPAPNAARSITQPQVQALPTGTFSNRSTLDIHTASEVLLIDADDMAIEDQMFLLAQLRRALANLPPGLQVAIFRVTGGRAVQIRGMTTDRDDLRRALGECLPILTHAIDSKFQSAVDQLLTVSAYLEQTPGRKNVLWFAGEFPLVQVAEGEQAPGGFTVDYQARQRTIHQIQEALAEARISVYPVDVRGVITYSMAGPREHGGQPSPDTHDMRSVSGMHTPTVGLPGDDSIIEQRDQMRQLASATGGKAYMLNNLSEEITQAFDLGLRAYTISYTPAGYATDESWHKVSITVDGGYRLSYRPGYLATSTGVPGGRQGFRLEDGRKVSTRFETGPETSKPLLFTVQVEPGSASGQTPVKKGRLRIALVFKIAADQINFVHEQDRWKSDLLVCSYAYDSDGKIQGGKLQEVNTDLSEEQWQRDQKRQVSTQQAIEIPHNAGYILMAVRDKRSKRIGTFLISMRAIRALEAPPANPATATAQPPQPDTHAPASMP